MNNTYVNLVIYLVPMLLLMAWYVRRRSRLLQDSAAALEESVKTGMTEPASLHPVTDPARCIGCGACVRACPEGNVLGLIEGKAHLVNPTHCIGHGACKRACPMDAISLVFGTEKRGVDIPFVQEDFQTNVSGIYIAGELGGMGLIRNAITQGRQAMDAIARLGGMGKGNDLDVVIVGAGPAGFAASLGAMEKKLRFVTLEQESFGGTVAHFPRGKIVMTAPVKLPIVGKVSMRETTKEALMDFWADIQQRTGLEVRHNERVESITPEGRDFRVKTNRTEYRCRAVLLAIGRRGTPRKLGVPGEEQSKVVYRLIDPEQYRNQHVLVVGGGDAALEAATSIADEPGTTVTLSYRSDGFSRAKEKNRQRVSQAEKDGRLSVMLKSNVREITDKQVTIDHDGKEITIDNDGVIVCAGGILPTKFLQDCGIEVETKHGTA
jgi:thioredoxin reductase/ferredoxin